MELEHRFQKPRPILQSIAVLSPKSMSFLDSKAILPLTETFNLDTSALRNQLEVASIMLKQRNVETLEPSLRALAETHMPFQKQRDFIRLLYNI